MYSISCFQIRAPKRWFILLCFGSEYCVPSHFCWWHDAARPPTAADRAQLLKLWAAAPKQEAKFSRCPMTPIFGLSGAAPAEAGDGAVAKTGFNQTLSTSRLSSLNFNYFDIDLLNSPIRSKEISTKHWISSVKFIICSVKSYTEAAFLFFLYLKVPLMEHLDCFI